ncbi:RNA methyltransferase [Pedobacter hartonius]|uniref:SpoU rRNA Methylase family protein n=1 Tax=Pedobacter hartonius TaxID=425514 RepID=A0A1H4HCK2_9SPHI|nr:RNA methyltransferase [Pedobacter hartonius]SEB19544.1 SpoU rRNA Methylase family protein [Pedobacter hartonius]
MQKLKTTDLNRVGIEEFKEQKKLPVVVVLDNVRSMNNVGSAFRTADGFAIEKMILCGITAQPPHREIEKTAIGATQSVNWEHYDETLEVIRKLRHEGYEIIAIEQAVESIMLNTFKPDTAKKYALIFGNEVNGVSEEVMAEIDKCIEIPQFGTKHSFNIVISAGIVLWDFYAKLRLQ